MVNLIATPERFNGKTVAVGGFLSVEYEKTAIYLSTEDAYWGASRNAIWLDLSAEQFDSFLQFRKQYVVVHGVFQADAHGHLDRYAAQIGLVSRVTPGP